jgi:hypothetical protein
LFTFFRKSKAPQDASSLDEVDLDIERIPGAVKIVDGFPRIEWPLVHQAAACYSEHAALNQIWTELAAQWLGIIRQHLPEQYHIYESEHLLLFSRQEGQAVKLLLDIGDDAYVRLEHLVQRNAQRRGQGKHAVLVLEPSDIYYDYVAYYYPERDRPYGASGGVHISRGYRHTVINGASSALTTLTHELAHDMVFDKPLPQWVNEGLAQFAEDMIPHYRPPLIDTRQARLQRRYWKWFGIEQFWNGSSFFSPSSQRLSYQLANILFRNLAGDAVRGRHVGRFLETADRRDAGRSACENCFGCSLSDLAGEFLGAGDWQPIDGHAAKGP